MCAAVVPISARPRPSDPNVPPPTGVSLIPGHRNLPRDAPVAAPWRTLAEALPALILVVPVLLPVATGSDGIDPVQFDMIACLNLTVGLLTPPVGVGLYTVAMQTGVFAGRLPRLVLPYLGGVVEVLAILTVLPGLALGPLTPFQ